MRLALTALSCFNRLPASLSSHRRTSVFMLSSANRSAVPAFLANAKGRPRDEQNFFVISPIGKLPGNTLCSYTVEHRAIRAAEQEASCQRSLPQRGFRFRDHL